MKTLILLALACTLVFAGCSSSDNNTNPTTTYSMTAKIDGASFTSSALISGVYTHNSLTVIGKSTDGRQISLVFSNPGAGKTYNMADAGESGATLMMSASVMDSFFAGNGVGTGSITITAFSSTEAKGTFTFTCMSGAMTTKSVTEGTFVVKLTTV
jgi:hypothetical protein